jgi:outer membrane protein
MHPGWRWLRPTVLAVGFLMAGQVASQDIPRIGFVNTERILREANIAKTAQQKLEQEFSKRQKELGDMQAALKALGDKYERDAPTLAESQRPIRQKEIAEQGRDFQRKQREFQEDLNGRRNEELQQVLSAANKAVRQVAESEKYDIVIQEVVYFNPKHDITERVLKILNAGAK